MKRNLLILSLLLFYVISGKIMLNGTVYHRLQSPVPNIIYKFNFRLTPVYAFVVFYYATVFNYIGSGPMWKIIVTQQNKACRENWYLNLLYLNNYIGEQNMVSQLPRSISSHFTKNVFFSVCYIPGTSHAISITLLLASLYVF